MSELRESAADGGRSIRQRLSSWLRAHIGRVIASLLTVIVAPIVVAVIVARLPAPSPGPGATASAAPVATTQLPAETEVRYFRPFTDVGLPPDYKVTQLKGDCFGPSSTSADPAALRCSSASDEILDPCWASIDRSQVACTIKPWAHVVTLLDPVDLSLVPEAEGLVTPDPERDPFAMEVVTADGLLYRCTAIVAYAGDVAGYRRNYECDAEPKGSELGYVFGDPDRSRSLWRVRFTTGSSTELVFAQVVRVWM